MYVLRSPTNNFCNELIATADEVIEGIGAQESLVFALDVRTQRSERPDARVNDCVAD
jgi:hypothetical protein